ncbi:MAG TPA: hypothetical protein DD786_08725 [Porphyromonadaceae bacterium]|nr:hypothetical protein [Porphyromonadaceae bacterium]HBQ57217.1 hypothetical protein [Porphyromonadaceae bacterium]
MMLFDEYLNGIVLMKNKARTSAKLNYDTANKKMMYLQNNDEMILLNYNQVDTVYIADKKFIPLHTVYLEVVHTKNSEIFIDWVLKDKYRGNRGAYGQITQNKVETINTAHWTNNEYKIQTAEVFERENANAYWIYIDDKPVRCRNEKDLLKYFPNRKEEIKAFTKNEKLNFKNPADAIRIIGFCLQ